VQGMRFSFEVYKFRGLQVSRFRSRYRFEFRGLEVGVGFWE